MIKTHFEHVLYFGKHQKDTKNDAEIIGQTWYKEFEFLNYSYRFSDINGYF